MYRRLHALFALVLLLAAAAAHSADDVLDPPGRVARLDFIAGPVSFAPYDAPEEWVQAVLNRPLTSGDRLWTDQGGRAELHVGSTAVRFADLTSADILNLDDRTFQIRLAQGTANVRVRDLAPGENVEIATPAGAVEVTQPGSYRVSVEPSGGYTRVLVAFGQAEIVTPTQTLNVPSSQAVTFAPGSAPQYEVAAYASGDEFDRWSADRDRHEDQSLSARYVSRDMTGYEDLDRYGAWRTTPEYGAVWTPSSVPSGWAPYRYGHWVWVSPWGWTWVDDAPWGFAPFHYGRWVSVGSRWAWAPGPVVRRPVYAPALVAFVGGSNFSVSVASGPAVGWFPLGWREPYIPWYRATPTHVRRVNVTQVNVTNINVTNIRYVNRERAEAVTVVPRQAFVSARPIGQTHLHVTRSELDRAEIVRERPPAEPSRASVAADRPAQRPPAPAAAREVVSTRAPERSVSAWRERPPFAQRGTDTEPRVRVVRPERGQAPAAAPRAEAPAAAREAPPRGSETPREAAQARPGPQPQFSHEDRPQPRTSRADRSQPQDRREERPQSQARREDRPQVYATPRRDDRRPREHDAQRERRAPDARGASAGRAPHRENARPAPSQPEINRQMRERQGDG
jgi:hypothetical protein